MSELKKKFEDKILIRKFKKDYSNIEFDCHVVSNILQPCNSKKFAEIEDYLNFWYSQKEYKMKFNFKFLIETYAEQALIEKFGKYDFKFEGNRAYKIYLLEYEELTFITPSKREVVLEKNTSIDNSLVKKLINFENKYIQLIFDYVIKNDLIKEYDSALLEELKNNNIIDSNNVIQFNESKNKITKKMI